VSLVLLPLLAAVAQPAAQLSPETTADLRCAAVFAYTAGSVKEEDQPGVVGGFLYFLGKIDARSPGLDLEANLTGMLTKGDFKTAILEPYGLGCAKELELRGSEISKVGKALSAKGM
jgi:hypothetical protein